MTTMVRDGYSVWFLLYGVIRSKPQILIFDRKAAVHVFHEENEDNPFTYLYLFG